MKEIYYVYDVSTGEKSKMPSGVLEVEDNMVIARKGSDEAIVEAVANKELPLISGDVIGEDEEDQPPIAFTSVDDVEQGDENYFAALKDFLMGMDYLVEAKEEGKE
jgi:hypothetical protein